MVRTIAAVAALALATGASAAAEPAKNFTGKFASKFAMIETIENKTEAVKDEAWELAAWKLNKTVHMADKLFEYKNKTEKALNLSKFEEHVDAKFDMLIDGLNETYQKVEGVKKEVEDKVEEPVKMVDDKIDTLKEEIEEKMAMLKNVTFGAKDMVEDKAMLLKNKTFGVKDMAEEKLEGLFNLTSGLKGEVEEKIEGVMSGFKKAD